MTTQRVGAFSAKNQFSNLLAQVARGQSYLITKRGKPVARLLPPLVAGSDEAGETLLATARRLRVASRAGPETLKQLIEEGRKH